METMTAAEIDQHAASMLEQAEARVRDLAFELRAFRHFLTCAEDDYGPMPVDMADDMVARRYAYLCYFEFGAIMAEDEG